MTEIFGSLLTSIFGNNSILATIMVAMFPIIELKGAIPVGMSIDFWGEHALSGSEAFVCSLVGSCLVAPILALVFQPIIKWMKSTRIFRNIASFIESKVRVSTDKISIKSQRKKLQNITIIKMLGVFAFVAVPLPLTGVWTGTCIGVMLGLKFWHNVLAVVLGNILAGIIVTFVCSVFPQFTNIIFFVFLAIVVCLMIYNVVKMVVNKNKTKSNIEN
jgi:uncharacterized membrane protein